MAWSGGSFTRTNGTYSGASVWQSDASAAIDIEADRHDTHDKDLADGINNCLTKDATNSPSAHVQWVNTNYYGSSAGSSGNYTLTLSPAATAYYAGMKVVFKANHSAGANASTLNINSLGAKNIRLGDTSLAPQFLIAANAMVEVVYDGTQFVLLAISPVAQTWTPTTPTSGVTLTTNVRSNFWMQVDGSANVSGVQRITVGGSAVSLIDVVMPNIASGGSSSTNIYYPAALGVYNNTDSAHVNCKCEVVPSSGNQLLRFITFDSGGNFTAAKQYEFRYDLRLQSDL